MRDLLKAYLYALPLVLIGAVILAIWFTPLVLWFLIAAALSMANYFLLIRIQNYQQINQKTVLLTLLIRYLIFVGALLTIMLITRNQPNFISIMIVTAIGISVMKLAAVMVSLMRKKGSVRI